MANMDETTCTTCNKTELDAGKPLKHCAKCKSTWYCSRECQTQGWKKHKKVCTSIAAANAAAPMRDTASNNAATHPARSPSASSETAPPYKNLEDPLRQPFHKLNEKKWLHERPEEDVFKLLLDSYRLRLNDDYNMSGDVDVDFLEGDQLKPFRKFLTKAERKTGLLPNWWSKQKAADCIFYGSEAGEHSWSSMPEKSDIMEYYGNPLMPMQLRMFAEQVYGRGPGGQSGASMMEMMMQQEGGDGGMFTSHLDMSRGMFGRR